MNCRCFCRFQMLFSFFLIIIISFSYSFVLPTADLQVDLLKYYSNNAEAYAQKNNLNNSTTVILVNDTWISKRDNLNISIKLDPIIPIIDQWTKLRFEIRALDSGKLVQDANLTVNTTISDHDGRLFKFPEQKVIEGGFNVSYIFPDDGQHRVILQLFKNYVAFTVANFDVSVPHPEPPRGIFEQLFQPQPY